jgi:hypothetical protein
MMQDKTAVGCNDRFEDFHSRVVMVGAEQWRDSACLVRNTHLPRRRCNQLRSVTLGIII